MGKWRSFVRGVRRTVRRAVSRLTTRRDDAPKNETRRLRRAFGKNPPPIRECACPTKVCGKGGWRGRYHPKQGVATVAVEKHMSPKMRKALRQHERAHGLVCDRKKCTYRGEHDRRFYKTLAKAHRTVGTDPKAALELEKRSGYRPPKSFHRSLRRR